MSNPDDDPAFDIDPDGDAAAYDEWAALAGEPARPPPEHPQREFADGRASFDAITSSLTKIQINAACHPGSILVLAGAGTGKTSTLTAAFAHRIAVDEIPPHRVLAVSSHEPTPPAAPSTPTIRPDGQRACAVCGAPAPFGFGVRLFHNRDGRWACFAHRDTVQALRETKP